MKQITIALLSLVIAVLLVGCGDSSKISKENFEKIKEGMTKAEVIAILGEPTGSEAVAEFNGKQIRGLVWQAQRIKIVTAFSADGKLSVRSIEAE